MKINKILLSFVWVLGVGAGVLAATPAWASLPDSSQICSGVAAPVVRGEKVISCSGQPVILKASGCEGTVVWSNGKSGVNLTSYPKATTTYTVHCQQTTCKTVESSPYVVTINIPPTPTVKASAKAICFGQSATLTVSDCAGQVIWSDGSVGSKIEVAPPTTTRYTATCKLEGCVSCFAEDIIITVKGKGNLLLTSSKPEVCAGDSLRLFAACTGDVRWSDGQVGASILVRPTSATVYKATCQDQQCGASTGEITAKVGAPLAPVLRAVNPQICKGKSTTLLASGCGGIVTWSNGRKGIQLDVSPTATATYSATCERGGCASAPADSVMVRVTDNLPTKPEVKSELVNTCPFPTADLSSAIKTTATNGITFEPHRSADPTSAIIEESGAVFASGTYYIFAKNAAGCYSEGAPVKVTITACPDGMPICMTVPARASIASEQIGMDLYRFIAILGGSANKAKWSGNGSGQWQYADSVQAIYKPSAADVALGTVQVKLETNDPDGPTGPCSSVVKFFDLSVRKKERPREIVGISKYISSWTKLGNKRFEVTYHLKVVNSGANDLIEVQITDSLDRVFKNGTQLVGKPDISFLNTSLNWAAEPLYSGQQGMYDLLLPDQAVLPKGETQTVVLRVTIDASNSTDTIFYNRAIVNSLDANGEICRDVSTNGKEVDPDQDGDPSNNAEATPVTVNGGGTTEFVAEISELFIPEGFSPNNDGINDFFVIKKPLSMSVSVEIYNRYGALVYKNDDYQNDWDGRNSLKDNKETLAAGTYFYSVKTSDGREFSRFMTISK